MTETWHPAVGWEGLYEVSDLGRVRRCEGTTTQLGRGGQPYHRRVPARILRPALNTKGYPFVALCQNAKHSSLAIHRLVCRAFHGEPPPGRNDACHINGDRTDNRAANLRWDDHGSNMRDRIAHGTVARGATNGRARLSEAQVEKIRARLAGGEKVRPIADHFGVNYRTVWQIKAGVNWKDDDR